MQVKKLLHDPTPNQVVAHRLFVRRFDMMACCDLTDEEKARIGDAIHRTCLKLLSAWKAMVNYRDLSLRLVEESRKAPRTNGGSVVHSEPSQELYEYLDAFLNQFKSTLDYVVKVGVSIFRGRRWSLRTFGDKGRNACNALDGLPKEFQPAAKELADFIRNNHEWLKDAIDFRDWINHGFDGGPDPEILEIYSVRRGDKTDTYCPLFRGTPLENVLEQLWWYLFLFVEGFIAHLLWSRAKAGFRLYHRPVTNDCQHPPWALFPDGVLEQIGHPATPVGKADEKKGETSC